VGLHYEVKKDLVIPHELVLEVNKFSTTPNWWNDNNDVNGRRRAKKESLTVVRGAVRCIPKIGSRTK
jgi:hypothetical protein